MQGFLQEGDMTELWTAFSRLRAEKDYVQHHIRRNGADVVALIDQGAHLYVCGDAKGMARDVHAAFVEVLTAHKRVMPQAAEACVASLQRDGRYQQDVW
jgi:sulfite reductase alpha subunit-like flavoprotein